MNKKLTLEQRIACLEKLLKNDICSRVYESADIEEFYKAVAKLYASGVTNANDMISPLNRLGFKVPGDFSLASLRNAVSTAWHKNMVRDDLTSSESDIESDVEDWFYGHMMEDNFESAREWRTELRHTAKKQNDMAVDDCCDFIGCDDSDAVASILAKLAKSEL